MLIISILAGLILGVAARAGESARKAQTQHTVLRLHKLLMPYYDTYKTRRVKVRPQIRQGIAASSDSDFDSPAEKGAAIAFARLYALRELMLMEMPDRWSDVLLTEVPNNPNGANTDARFPYFQDSSSALTSLGRSGLAAIYLRRYDQIAKGTNSLSGNPNTRDEIIANQGAECLYLLITLATGEGEARSHFGEDSIGDTDGDGAFEFLDSWGRPISFLRWAPGFDSQVQINANQFQSISVTDAWKAAASGDHDPFDLFRVDPPAFRLVPLIFSIGGDETAGIDSIDGYFVLQGLTPGQLGSEPEPGEWPAIFPWASVPNPNSPPPRMFLGTAVEEGSADNIHNHLLGRR
jgi:hypothetical protein